MYKFVIFIRLRWGLAMAALRRDGAVELEDIHKFTSYLPSGIRRSLYEVDETVLDGLIEVRLRLGKPVMLIFDRGERLLGHNGLCRTGEVPMIFTRAMRDETLQLLTDRSVYAVEEELKSGYITIPGGHRVGVVGRAVVSNGAVEAIVDISGINLRMARDVREAAAEIVPHIVGGSLGVYRTLVYSPPGCGKTTLLRDLARRLSDGIETPRPFRVAIVDERSELAGCYRGEPQRDVGSRTDVLDRAPKAVGIMTVIRSMSPEVVITDELGRVEDIRAVEECMNAGVALIASAHAGSLEELACRPAFAAMMSRNCFDLYVRLSNRPKVGTIAEISSKSDAANLVGAKLTSIHAELGDSCWLCR